MDEKPKPDKSEILSELKDLSEVVSEKVFRDRRQARHAASRQKPTGPAVTATGITGPQPLAPAAVVQEREASEQLIENLRQAVESGIPVLEQAIHDIQSGGDLEQAGSRVDAADDKVEDAFLALPNGLRKDQKIIGIRQAFDQKMSEFGELQEKLQTEKKAAKPPAEGVGPPAAEEAREAPAVKGLEIGEILGKFEDKDQVTEEEMLARQAWLEEFAQYLKEQGYEQDEIGTILSLPSTLRKAREGCKKILAEAESEPRQETPPAPPQPVEASAPASSPERPLSPQLKALIDDYNHLSVPDQAEDARSAVDSRHAEIVGVTNAEERTREPGRHAAELKSEDRGDFYAFELSPAEMIMLPRPGRALNEGRYREGAWNELFDCRGVDFNRQPSYKSFRVISPASVRKEGDQFVVIEKGSLDFTTALDIESAASPEEEHGKVIRQIVDLANRIYRDEDPEEVLKREWLANPDSPIKPCNLSNINYNLDIITDNRYVFLPAEETVRGKKVGGWIWYQPRGSTEAWVLPVVPALVGRDAMVLAKSMFDGYDKIPDPLRFKQAIKPVHLRLSSNQSAPNMEDYRGRAFSYTDGPKYEVVDRGYLILGEEKR